MRRTLIFALLIFLGYGLTATAADPDIACGNWVKGGGDKSTVISMEQASTTQFNAIGAGATVEKTFGLCVNSAELSRLVLSSTDCTNCDIHVGTATSTGGTRTIMENSTAGAASVNGVAYTSYLNAVDLGPVLTATLNEDAKVYVRIKNNDLGARSCIVRLTWESK